MAHYVELPVYKASYDLLLYLFQLTGNLSREYKYTLGEKIKNETTDLLMHIYSANKKIEKLNDLGAARESLERIRLYIRLLLDTKQIGQKKFVYCNGLIENVSKQLAGWYNAASKNK